MKKFKPHNLEKLAIHYSNTGNYFQAVYPSHPYSASDGRIMLHRLIMENHLGRYLEPHEVVHHKDRNRQNNRLSNLQLTTTAEHHHLHRTDPPIRICQRAECGRKFVVTDRLASASKYSSDKYCSKRCREKTRRLAISKSVKKSTGRKGASGRPSARILRKLVWSMPTRRVAKRFGVSDSAVAKWCKFYGIEKPPRGYWTARSL